MSREGCRFGEPKLIDRTKTPFPALRVPVPHALPLITFGFKHSNRIGSCVCSISPSWTGPRLRPRNNSTSPCTIRKRCAIARCSNYENYGGSCTLGLRRTVASSPSGVSHRRNGQQVSVRVDFVNTSQEWIMFCVPSTLTPLDGHHYYMDPCYPCCGR